MSGAEVAGFVLAAIPLLISGLEHYTEGVTTIRRYLKYKNELRSLLRNLNTEYDIFRNTCEELLEGIAPARKMALLLENPGSDLWKDQVIEQKLKNRLQSSYSGYLETVDDMEDAVNEFKRRLKLGSDGKVQFSNTSTFKQAYKKLQFSLSRSAYADLINRIKQDNHTLSQLTKQSLGLEISRARRRRRAPNFKGIRDCARSVHAILCSGWRCGCQESHTVNLRLETRTEEGQYEDEEDELAREQLRFRVLFFYGHSSPKSVALPWSWEEADIRLLKDDPLPPSEVAELAPPAPKANVRKGVRFKEQAQTAVTKALDQQPDLVAIQDLCRAIQKLQQPQRAMCLGFLRDEATRQRHGIFPVKMPPTDRASWSVVSLNSVMASTTNLRRRFTRGDKLRLAVILASSVLQLCHTPWLGETWGKDDIVFIQRNEGPLYEHPFISRRFIAGASPPTSPNFNIDSLLLLHRWIRNPTLFALGVLLIELCLGKPISELQGPHESNSGFNLNSTWIAADRLVEVVYLEGGTRYGDAVRHCVRCDFDQQETSLDDETFQDAVYDGVVGLLEDDLREFHCL